MIAELASVSFPALGTTALLCVDDPGRLAPAQEVLERELVEIDRACSRFRDDSELVRLNAAAGTGPVEVGARLLEAVEVALGAAVETRGLVDPTVGRTLRLAGYDRRFATVKLRDGAAFHARFAVVPGFGGIQVDPARRTIALDPEVELDLGATAKALAADRSAREAARVAGCGVLVSLGGDVSVAGPPPDAGWPIRVADDHAGPLDAPGPAVAIRTGGLATSGTTVRRWRAGALELHHIVDPRTGRPAVTPWRTVTVAGRSCVEANVASTAAMVLGDGAPGWLEERGAAARLVRDSGEVVLAGPWPEDAA
ncbi:MAG TPA: FAD:protein FMN transferase [Gaiellaceae bacterium]|nr:FAD:protein FMN transferase [Gaiellaceae bacterium]